MTEDSSKFNVYVGIPYLPYGRTLKGLDCYGIVWLIQKDLYGKNLPCFDLYEDNRVSFFRNELDYIPNEKIEDPKEGDIISMKLLRCIHLGVMIDSKRFIHSGLYVGDFSSIGKLQSSLCYNRIEGFYRV